MWIFSIHLLLMALIVRFALKPGPEWAFESKFLAGFVITWASVIISSTILACFNQVGHDALFFSLSLVCQLALALVLSRRGSRTGEAALAFPAQGLWSLARETFSTLPRRVALVSTVCFAALILFMCIRSNLQIPDTLSIKLPNAWFYLKSGNFLPVVERSDDGRMFATPINGTMLWIYLIRWDQPTRLILLFNFVCWAAMFLAIYRASRLIGASRWGGFSAAALFCLTQTLLLQASTDNDDLMSSVTATIGAAFFLMWLKSRSLADLSIAAIGIGISAGSKYFPVLYLPGAMLCAGYYLWIFVSRKDWSELAQRGRQLVIGGVVAAAFVMPYEGSRLIQTAIGRASPDLISGTDNKPFRWSVAAHNTVVYNLQLFASPLTDAFFPKSGGLRRHSVQALNDWSVRNLIPKVTSSHAYDSTIEIANIYLYDHTVRFGVVSWLLAIGILAVLLKKRDWLSPAFWLVIFFISWNLFFCFRTKYMDVLGRYWILPISLLMPLAALSVDRIANARIFGRTILPLVWASTLFCGFVGLSDNRFRHNLAQLVYASAAAPAMAPELRQLLATCDHVNVARVVYGFPIYWLMKWFQGSDFSYTNQLSAEKINIVPALDVPGLFHGYEHRFLAVELGPERMGMFAYFGLSGFLSEWTGKSTPIYAAASATRDCETVSSGGPSYLLAQVTPLTAKSLSLVNTRFAILGVRAGERLRFRAAMQNGSQIHYLNEWTSEFVFRVDVPDTAETLRLEVTEQNPDLQTDRVAVFVGSLPWARK